MQRITQRERKELIRRMKRESRPGRSATHIILLAADGYPPARNRRVLFCSRTTVYANIRRFCRVSGPRKTDQLSLKLLDELGRIYRCHRRLHRTVDDDGDHTSERIENT